MKLVSTYESEFVQTLCFCFLMLYSSGLYSIGFFPPKPPNYIRSEWHHLSTVTEKSTAREEFSNQPKYRKLVSKLVLMVVDGMRNDMAQNLSTFKMVKQKNIASAGIMKFVAKAETPTVTMPRIKAIVTGDVPAFVDVFGNMDASRFEGDSLIDQWFDRGYKVTMFGDETWHRLWGDKFVRSDPVTFFVNEYVQVDLNVSRHLEKELKRDDWQVMILHFGGLDHIGHLYGAFSSLSPGKLEEMDRYITQILDGLKKNDKGDNDWMLAVTSDHGQADAGGHGGPTENEVLTPLLIASPLIKRVSSHPKETLVKQIDITSTLAYLTGVPVPAKNSGMVIIDLIESIVSSREAILRYLNYNSQQLKKLLEEVSSSAKLEVLGLEQAIQRHHLWLRNYPSIDESQVDEVRQNAFNKVRSEYISALKEASDAIASHLTKFEPFFIYVSLFTIWTLLMFLILRISTAIYEDNRKRKRSGIFFNIVASTPHILTISVFMVSSSIFVTLITVSGVRIPLGSIIFFGSSFFAILSFAFLLVVLVIIFVTKNAVDIRIHRLIIWVAIHSVLMTSSSFIEEEHQIVYFVGTSALIIIIIQRLSQHNIVLYMKKLEDSTNPRTINAENSTRTIAWVVPRDVVSAVAALCLFRLIRKFNQTGDKWLSYPDIGDWLLQDGNQLFLGSLYCGACVAVPVLLLIAFRSIAVMLLSSLGFVLVVGYHASAYKIDLIDYMAMDDHGLFYASCLRCYFAVLIVSQLLSNLAALITTSPKIVDTKKSLSAMLFIYSLLLQVPQDFFVLILLVLFTYLLNPVLSATKLENVDQFFICNMFARSAFFVLGNCNSFTTIDIQAAYTGLSDHNLAMVAFQLFLVMFSGPLIIYSQMNANPVLINIDNNTNTSSNCVLFLLTYRCCTCAVVLTCSWFLRFHIMTWTVFSPKVIFEIGWAIFDCLLAIVFAATAVIKSL
ncbi:uncharacterized protein LOC134847183 isoform X2 [Symsagittifera roscoffensis]|uniref:uncharacterized protein LOC134847183 isoform X2 n=1 Tax=Symsagittifera roscoffensis TaxID=84072 RepID=UPI00307B52BF